MRTRNVGRLRSFFLPKRADVTFGLAIALLFLIGSDVKAQQQPVAPAAGISAITQQPRLTVSEVVSHLEQRNRERAAALGSFQASRTYHMQYRGPFGNRDAEMTVRLTYNSPNEKTFVVLSQSGNTFILEHVFKRLLQEERDASNEENRQRTALSSKNYEFTLAGYEDTPDAPQYVLNVLPKTENKYLYRGKIWVDAKDFALTRIEAEPAKNPSFWIKKSEIKHKYQKVDEFWLPQQTKSESWVRMGGYAILTIEYQGYTITGTAPLEASGKILNSSRVAQ